MTNDLTILRAEITRLRRAMTVLQARYANLPDELMPRSEYLYDELPDHLTRPVINDDDSHDHVGTVGSDK